MESPAMAFSPRKIAQVLLYLAVTGVVLLVLSEGAVRMLKLAPPLTEQYLLMKRRAPDPVLPYKLRPSIAFTGRSDTDEFDFRHIHNSSGFRDEEHAYRKPAGVFRILGLGDDFTYGIGARYEESYLRRVEQALNARSGVHPPIEVIKAGIPRYFTQPERMFLQVYGVRYRPDIVLVGFEANDVIDTYLGLEAVRVDESGYLKLRDAREIGPAGTFLYIHSDLARIALSRYMKRRIAEKYRIVRDEAYRPDGLYEDDWRQIEKELTTMAEISHSIGARMVLLYIAEHDIAERTAVERDYPPRRLSKWADRNGATFVDTTPAILAAMASSPTPLYYSRDTRCTPTGYAVVADVLYKALTENRLVP